MAKAAKRKRSSSSSSGGGSHKPAVLVHTNAPHSTTLIISAIVFALGILGAIIYIPVLTALSFWLALIGYLILVAGCVMKGM
jgi:hypothetical protein